MGTTGGDDVATDVKTSQPSTGAKLVNGILSIMSGMYTYTGASYVVSGITAMLSPAPSPPPTGQQPTAQTVTDDVQTATEEKESANGDNLRDTASDNAAVVQDDPVEELGETQSQAMVTNTAETQEDDLPTPHTPEIVAKTEETDDTAIVTETVGEIPLEIVEHEGGTGESGTVQVSAGDRAVATAKLLQASSQKTLQALRDEAPPAGYAPLTPETIRERLTTSVAFGPVKLFQPVISLLVGGKSEPEASEIDRLNDNAEKLIKAMADARDEVLAELKDRKQQVEDQRKLVGQQIESVTKLLERLSDPSQLAGTLLKSWPREIKREDLGEKFQALVKQDELNRIRTEIIQLQEVESQRVPWVDADWFGNVQPDVARYENQLRKQLADVNVKAQEVVVSALDRALVAKRGEETENKKTLIAAIKGGKERVKLSEDLTRPARDIYNEIQDQLLKNKLNIEQQVGLANDAYNRRDEEFKAQQTKLRDTALKTGVLPTAPNPAMYGGLQYRLLGSHGASVVYARLEDCPKNEGMGAFMSLFETALGKGIIASGGTGSEGVKYESHLGGWVVKVTMRAVAHNTGFDNVWSPLAEDGKSVVQLDDPPLIYLNFNQWVKRH